MLFLLNLFIYLFYYYLEKQGQRTININLKGRDALGFSSRAKIHPQSQGRLML